LRAFRAGSASSAILNFERRRSARATVAIGNAGNRGKYKRRGECSATPTRRPCTCSRRREDDAPLADYEDVILTIGAANLPGAGIVVVEILTSGR
jgi:hypothetical protein